MSEIDFVVSETDFVVSETDFTVSEIDFCRDEIDFIIVKLILPCTGEIFFAAARLISAVSKKVLL